MATNVQRITVQCACGKLLTAMPQHAGKRLKCPACGQPVVVPEISKPESAPVAPQMEAKPDGTLIALCISMVVFVLGCVLFVAWYSHSLHQAKITAANERISRAVDTANEWVTENSSLDGEAVEQQLADALKDEDATEMGSGESVLGQVRQRREQLAEQARIERGRGQATAIFNDAKRQISNRRIEEAIAGLWKYVADPNATEKAEAQILLAEAEIAISDTFMIETLVSMSDEYFDRVKTSGIIDDGKVKHPVLLTVRNETIQRNIDKANQRREEIRIAEEKRREAEQLATLERQRQEAERRSQEAARRSEAELLRAEAERPKDGSEVFGEIIAFHERYMGQNFYIKGLYYPRKLQRERDAKCFSITFVATKGKGGAVSGLLMHELSFVVSEAMGSQLLTLASSRSEYHTAVVSVRIAYLDEKNKSYPIGYVKQLDLYTHDKKTLENYLFITLYADGSSKVHPNPFDK